MNKPFQVSIEYCTAWGYLPKVMDLTKELLEALKNDITIISLLPSGGGVFEVKINDHLIFSKKELDRFPEPGEILEKMQ